MSPVIAAHIDARRKERETEAEEIIRRLQCIRTDLRARDQM